MAVCKPRELPSGTPPLKCAVSISEAKSPTTKHVKAYVRRVSSKQLLVYPTWDLSKPLPSLPVPGLAHTLEMYLKVLHPITTSEQYAQATRLVQQFQDSDSGPGHKLQQWLQSRSTVTDNWAYSWWLDDMYLLNQAPLPINSNPGMVFPRISFSKPDDQLRFAARLVSGILDYKVIIDARGLPIDRARHREKGQPLCMEQYYRLFSSYREPGVRKDRLITTEYNTSAELSDHIIVMCRNKMYQLNVVDGVNRLSEDDICCQLRRIQSMAEQSALSDSARDLGILTAMPRDEWARTRLKLKDDPVNADSLLHIETSIFILCLDKLTGSDTPLTDTHIALQMLHGHGSHLNSCNRWYDKTMQFIVGADGACGLNYEHSPSEGIAVVQLIEHVLRYMEELRQRKLVRMNSNADLPYPNELKWNITTDIIQTLDMARFNMDRSIADLELSLLKFDDFGKEFPKSQNMSPDCFIQLALQLTYFKLNGHLVSTYESASTRRFKLGRVDNIRAASSEALCWCQAMEDDSQTAERRLVLLREAMASQTEYMVQTILGHGMDCHLLGLQRVSEEMEGTTPDLFLHDTWKLCNHFSLSTSQVITTLDSFICYGPVVPDGYGASYNPQDDQIMFCISSFASCEATDARVFADTLQRVLRDMRDMCLLSERGGSAKLGTIQETSQSRPNESGSLQ